MAHGVQAVARLPIGPTHRLVRPVGAFATGLMLAWAPAATAQDAPADACKDPVSQNELTACAWQEADKADADMAIALARAMKTMEAIDKDVSEARPNPAGGVEALELSQQGWLQYREGRCIIEGFDERGGSMEPMMVGHCQGRVTRDRIAELNKIAESE
jgi:uncharacterized protein YecT (DUF1311 family)